MRDRARVARRRTARRWCLLTILCALALSLLSIAIVEQRWPMARAAARFFLGRP